MQWVRYWFGVFSEQSYPGDDLYPGQGTSCHQTDWWRLCPEHKHYDRRRKTKQNLLCEGQSAREIIELHHMEGRNATSGRSEVIFSYVKPLASSYKLVLDTSSYMGHKHRWENVRRALHRFIHLLPLGTTIRFVPDHQAGCQLSGILRIPVYFSLLGPISALAVMLHYCKTKRWFLCCSQIGAIKKGES